MQKIKVKQIRSVIDRPVRQKRTIEALGLGRPNWEVIHNDTPQIRGMVNKIPHLVEVSEYKPTSAAKEKTKPAAKKKAPVKKTPSASESGKTSSKENKETKSEE
jgi:large subunit ribosomal protein L30